MKFTLKSIFKYFELLLIIFYLLIEIGFILDLNGILSSITKYASWFILWPFFSDLFGFLLLISLIVYYLVLFAIPIIGFIIYRKKYLIIHIFLGLLAILNLISFVYAITGLARL